MTFATKCIKRIPWHYLFSSYKTLISSDSKTFFKTIVFLILPTGKKRRMCSKCKADALERRKINNIKLGFQKRT